MYTAGGKTCILEVYSISSPNNLNIFR